MTVLKDFEQLSLVEFISTLPPDHKAHQEYTKLYADFVALSLEKTMRLMAEKQNDALHQRIHLLNVELMKHHKRDFD